MVFSGDDAAVPSDVKSLAVNKVIVVVKASSWLRPNTSSTVLALAWLMGMGSSTRTAGTAAVTKENLRCNLNVVVIDQKGKLLSKVP